MAADERERTIREIMKSTGASRSEAERAVPVAARPSPPPEPDVLLEAADDTREPEPLPVAPYRFEEDEPEPAKERVEPFVAEPPKSEREYTDQVIKNLTDYAYLRTKQLADASPDPDPDEISKQVMDEVSNFVEYNGFMVPEFVKEANEAADNPSLDTPSKAAIRVAWSPLIPVRQPGEKAYTARERIEEESERAARYSKENAISQAMRAVGTMTTKMDMEGREAPKSSALGDVVRDTAMALVKTPEAQPVGEVSMETMGDVRIPTAGVVRAFKEHPRLQEAKGELKSFFEERPLTEATVIGSTAQELSGTEPVEFASGIPLSASWWAKRAGVQDFIRAVESSAGPMHSLLLEPATAPEGSLRAKARGIVEAEAPQVADIFRKPDAVITETLRRYEAGSKRSEFDQVVAKVEQDEPIESVVGFTKSLKISQIPKAAWAHEPTRDEVFDYIRSGGSIPEDGPLAELAFEMARWEGKPGDVLSEAVGGKMTPEIANNLWRRFRGTATVDDLPEPMRDTAITKESLKPGVEQYRKDWKATGGSSVDYLTNTLGGLMASTKGETTFGYISRTWASAVPAVFEENTSWFNVVSPANWDRGFQYLADKYPNNFRYDGIRDFENTNALGRIMAGMETGNLGFEQKYVDIMTEGFGLPEDDPVVKTVKWGGRILDILDWESVAGAAIGGPTTRAWRGAKTARMMAGLGTGASVRGVLAQVAPEVVQAARKAAAVSEAAAATPGPLTWSEATKAWGTLALRDPLDALNFVTTMETQRAMARGVDPMKVMPRSFTDNVVDVFRKVTGQDEDTLRVELGRLGGLIEESGKAHLDNWKSVLDQKDPETLSMRAAPEYVQHIDSLNEAVRIGMLDPDQRNLMVALSESNARRRMAAGEISSLGQHFEQIGLRLAPLETPSAPRVGGLAEGRPPEVQMLGRQRLESALRMDKTSSRLLDNGTIIIVDSYRDLPGDSAPDAKGGYAGGKTWLVADNISAADIDGLVTHEAGAHALLDHLRSKGDMKSLRQADILTGRAVELAAKDTPTGRRVRAHVETERKGRAAQRESLVADGATDTELASFDAFVTETLKDEHLAYLVEFEPQHTIARRFLAWVRRVLFEAFGAQWAGKLTEADLQAIAKSYLRRKAGKADAAGGPSATKPVVSVDPVDPMAIDKLLAMSDDSIPPTSHLLKYSHRTEADTLVELRKAFDLWAQERGLKGKKLEAEWKRVSGNRMWNDLIVTLLEDYDLDALMPQEAARVQGRKAWLSGGITGNTDKMYVVSSDIGTDCLRRERAMATAAALLDTLSKNELTPEQMTGVIYWATARFRKEGKLSVCGYCYVDSPRLLALQVAASSLPDIDWDALDMGYFLSASDRARVMADPAHPRNTTMKGVYDQVDAAMSKSKAKGLEGYSEYRGQWLLVPEETFAQMHAGVRFQSNSDFKVEHVFDLSQQISDLAFRKQRGHIYVKIPLAVEFLHGTNMKINMSVAWSVDEAGRALDDEFRLGGMSIRKAKELHAKYEKMYPGKSNVGIIAVLGQDKAIWQALDDPNVHYIIPFHASGQTLKRFRGYGWSNYQGKQRARHWSTWNKKQRALIQKGGGYAGAINRALERAGSKVRFNLTDIDPSRADIRMYEIPGIMDGLPDEVATIRYLEVMAERGMVPPFPEFVEHPNYFKLRKDYARTDTPYVPLSTDFDLKAIEPELRKWLDEGGRNRDAVDREMLQALQAEFKALGPAHDWDLEAERAMKQAPRPPAPVAKEGGWAKDRALYSRRADTAGAATPDEVAEAARAWQEQGTDSPWFKRWFGDSKVVDAEGKPLVVYHGTGADGVDAFDSSKIGSNTDIEAGQPTGAFFFTTEREVADGYADVQDGVVVPVYLRATRVKEVAPDANGFMPRNATELIAKARADGFDAVVFRNVDDGLGAPNPASDVWAVFSPEQVKSATGNRGTFAPDDARLLYSRRLNPDDPNAVAAIQVEEVEPRFSRRAAPDLTPEQQSEYRAGWAWAREEWARRTESGESPVQAARAIIDGVPRKTADRSAREIGIADSMQKTKPLYSRRDLRVAPTPNLSLIEGFPPVEVRQSTDGDWYLLNRNGAWGDVAYATKADAEAALNEPALRGQGTAPGSISERYQRLATDAEAAVRRAAMLVPGADEGVPGIRVSGDLSREIPHTSDVLTEVERRLQGDGTTEGVRALREIRQARAQYDAAAQTLWAEMQAGTRFSRRAQDPISVYRDDAAYEIYERKYLELPTNLRSRVDSLLSEWSRTGEPPMALEALYDFPPPPRVGLIIPSTDWSATGDALVADGFEPDRLVVQHNITQDKLAKAERSGGLIAPSLAVSKVDMPLHEFGDITLIADRRLADPRTGTPVFDADVYTPRTPRTENLSKPEDISAVMREMEQKSPYRFPPGAEYRGQSPFYSLDHAAAMAAYLTERGVEIPPPAKFPKGTLQDADPRLRPLLDRVPDAALAPEALRANDPALYADFQEALYGDREGPPPGTLSRMEGVLGDEAFRRGLQDEYVNNNNLYDLVRRNGGLSNYTAWLQQKVGEIPSQPFLGREPATPERMVATMQKAPLRAGEDIGSSEWGAVRARIARQFESTEDVAAARGQIEPVKHYADRDEFDAMAQDVAREVEQTVPGGRVDGDTERLAEQIAAAQAELADASGYVSDLDRLADETLAKYAVPTTRRTPELRQRLVSLLERLRDMTTEYFEAKPMRPVRLDEFEVAVVPEDMVDSVAPMLTRSGMDVVGFNRWSHGGDVEAARRAAIAFAAKRANVLFSRRAMSELQFGAEPRTGVYDEAISDIHRDITSTPSGMERIPSVYPDWDAIPRARDMAPSEPGTTPDATGTRADTTTPLPEFSEQMRAEADTERLSRRGDTVNERTLPRYSRRAASVDEVVSEHGAFDGTKGVLFRAANDASLQPGASTTPDPTVAKSYTENQGFGGQSIYAYRVDWEPGDVLTITDGTRLGLREIAEALDEIDGTSEASRLFDEEWTPDRGYDYAHDAIDEQSVRDRLAQKYKAVRYPDSYPENADTIVVLRSEGIEPVAKIGDEEPRFSRRAGQLTGAFYGAAGEPIRHTATTARWLMELFHGADYRSLFHENGHLMQELVGGDGRSLMAAHFDSIDATTVADIKAREAAGETSAQIATTLGLETLVEDAAGGVTMQPDTLVIENALRAEPGQRALTRRGMDQAAEAVRQYLENHITPRGELGRMMAALGEDLGGLWLSYRGQADVLPREIRDYWDRVLRPDQVANAQAVRMYSTPGQKDFPVVMVSESAVEMVEEAQVRRAGQAREATRLGGRPEEILQSLGLKVGDQVPMDELMSRIVAYVVTEKAREWMVGQDMKVLTPRTVVPAARVSTVNRLALDRITQALGMSPRDLVSKQRMKRPQQPGVKGAARAKVGLDYEDAVTLDPPQQAGLRVYARELESEPMAMVEGRSLVPDRFLDPNSSLDTVTFAELNRLQELAIDASAGVAARRSKRAESVPSSAATALVKVVAGLPGAAARKMGVRGVGLDEVLSRASKLFIVEKPTGGYADPLVDEMLERAGRALGDAPAWFKQQARAQRATIPLAKRWGFAANVPGIEDTIRGVSRQLTPEIAHNGDVGVVDQIFTLRDRYLNGASDVTTLLDPLEIAALHEGLDSWRHGTNAQEFAAIQTLELYRGRNAATLAPHEIAHVEDALSVVVAGLDARASVVEQRGAEIALILAGSRDSNIALSLEWHDRVGVYKDFYQGRWYAEDAPRANEPDQPKSLAWRAETRGLTGWEGKKYRPQKVDVDPNTVLVEMVVRMRANEIMLDVADEMTRYGLFGREVQDIRVRDRFHDEVLGYIHAMTAWNEVTILTRDTKTVVDRAPPAKDLGLAGIDWSKRGGSPQFSGPHNMEAYRVAYDLLDRWGWQHGKGEWTKANVAGQQVLVPVMGGKRIVEALDEAANIGTAFGSARTDVSPTGLTGTGGIIPENIVQKALALPTRAFRQIKMGLVVGILVPNVETFTGNLMNGITGQWYQVKGLPNIIRSHLSPNQMRLVSGMMMRMWGDGRVVPGGGVLVTKNGRIHGVNELVRMAREHGLDSSFLKAETADALVEDVKRMHRGPFSRTAHTILPIEFYQQQLVTAYTSIDNWSRAHIFLDELRNGADPSKAAEVARLALFDYSRLTDFEKKWMRKAVLFYAFERANQTLFWWTLLNHPGRVLGQLRLIRDLKQEYLEDDWRIVVPEYHEGRYMLAYESLYENGKGMTDRGVDVDRAAGMTPEWRTRYQGVAYISKPVTAVDGFMLWADIYDMAAGILSRKGDRDAMANMVGKLHPSIQAPAVGATGTDIFSGRRIDDYNNVPMWFIAEDRAMTGGLIVDKMLNVHPIPEHDPARRQNPDIPYVWRTDNGWRWWAIQNLGAGIPGLGRTLTTMDTLDRASNKGPAELLVETTQKARESVGMERAPVHPLITTEMAGPRAGLTEGDEMSGFYGLRVTPVKSQKGARIDLLKEKSRRIQQSTAKMRSEQD